MSATCVDYVRSWIQQHAKPQQPFTVLDVKAALPAHFTKSDLNSVLYELHRQQHLNMQQPDVNRKPYFVLADPPVSAVPSVEHHRHVSVPDYVSRLNLWCQQHHSPLPVYDDARDTSAAPQAIQFAMTVRLMVAADEPPLYAQSSLFPTKKEAKQDAARLMLRTLQDQPMCTSASESSQSLTPASDDKPIIVVAASDERAQKIVWNKDTWHAFLQRLHTSAYTQMRRIVFVDYDNKNLTLQDIECGGPGETTLFVTLGNADNRKRLIMNHPRVVHFKCNDGGADLVDVAICGSVLTCLLWCPNLKVCICTSDHFAIAVKTLLNVPQIREYRELLTVE